MNILAILPKGFRTEMIFSVSTEARIFLSSVVIGILFGLGYEVMRILRRTVPHNDIAVFVEDFLFVLVCAFWYYIFVTAAAWGQLRFFVFIGMTAGMALEQLTVGEIVVQSAAVILSTVFAVIVAKPVMLIVRNAKNVRQKFVQSSKVFRFTKKQGENA